MLIGTKTPLELVNLSILDGKRLIITGFYHHTDLHVAPDRAIAESFKGDLPLEYILSVHFDKNDEVRLGYGGGREPEYFFWISAKHFRVRTPRECVDAVLDKAFEL